MKSLFMVVFLLAFVALIGLSSVFIISTIRLALPEHMHALYSYIWIPFAVFPLIFIAITLSSNIYYIEATRIFYLFTSLWLPLLIHMFIGAVIFRLYLLVNTDLHVIAPDTVALILSGAIVLVMGFGIWRALTYRITTYTIHAPELREAWGDKKIVLFSDSHIGLIRGADFMKKIVTTVNSLSPDIVFIAGDLIDGPLFPFERDLSPLKEIKSTYGTFYTAGNHDEYNREQAQYAEVLKNYVTILNDKKVVINKTQIVGIQFATESMESTRNKLLATGFEKLTPSIALLHDPKNTRALADAGVTLSLSGHTHGGQFWPFTTIVHSIYTNLTKGVSYLGESAHFTTVGVGTWGPLFRLGARPEIVIIQIQ